MLHIICALKHEARPLIGHYRLVHDGSAVSFNTYINKESGITLTVTGAGREAAAAGTAFAASHHHAGAQDTWLNIGIAGHRDLPVGEPVLAGRITDAATQETWLPRINFPTGLKTLPLITFNQPVEHYPDNDMVDMEAAGFYRSVTQFGTASRIHCLKIISDNQDHPPDKISGQAVRELVTASLPAIAELIGQLLSASTHTVTA